MYSELLFRRFFAAKKTATKTQLQSSRVMAALGLSIMEFHVDEVLESSIVTGRNGNFDIPVGTVFTKIVKSRFEGEIGNSVRMTCKSLNTIELELVSVNWYRRKIDHIPRDHTAELKLKGNGIGQLEKFLAELKSDEYVYIQA